MNRSLLALPFRAVLASGKIGGKVARRLVFPALAVTLVRRALSEPSSAPAAKVTPDPGPEAKPTSTPASAGLRAVPEPSPEPMPVVDPVPLAEAAVDLDVEVTLPSELPIRSYDALAAADAKRMITELTDADEVRAVLAFEEENAKRSTVIAAARARLRVLDSGAAVTTPGSG
ncbi:MAG TPA: hypothetical protein VMZ00_13560 [Sporichthya sp.]|nr:hypothetical protein [Sporichthya sp.]